MSLIPHSPAKLIETLHKLKRPHWRKQNRLYITMFHVYLIRSLLFPELFYVGYTTDFIQRLKTHNSGGSIHTAKSRPWELVVLFSFVDQEQAKLFEKYLKSQSGRAFAKKRFLS